MTLPNIDCEVEVFSPIHMSEDPEKVKKAILNVFSGFNIKNQDFSVIAKTNNFQSMEKIHEVIHSTRSQRVLERQLEKHMDVNSTWFYLNKQAAFVNRIVLCEEADESPLGPLKIILTSRNINRVIESIIFE